MMDDYDPQARSKSRDRIFNLLTVLTLVSLVCLTTGFVVVYNNPYTFLNPFPPLALPTPLSLPTASPTSIMALPPTWTATASPAPTATETQRPTATLPLTATTFSLVTPSPTATATEPPNGYPFEVQKGSPVAIANIYHPELGCNWMGVGGQAVDLSGGPVTGLIIRMGGAVPGIDLPELVMNLTGVALNYGRGGYEFTLADHPIASKQTLWVQLLNQSSVPLSKKIYFNTYDDCSKNLIIINFKQVR
ncbi:MAG TPA: hypothetical protein VLM80_00230 [Anaerolineales bacterium]|nr:hypothetical protein [Anaerolineales bacterium]